MSHSADRAADMWCKFSLTSCFVLFVIRSLNATCGCRRDLKHTANTKSSAMFLLTAALQYDSMDSTSHPWSWSVQIQFGLFSFISKLERFACFVLHDVKKPALFFKPQDTFVILLKYINTVNEHHTVGEVVHQVWSGSDESCIMLLNVCKDTVLFFTCVRISNISF